MIWSALSLPSRNRTLRWRLLPFGADDHSKPMIAVNRPGSLYFSAAAVMRCHTGSASVRACDLRGSCAHYWCNEHVGYFYAFWWLRLVSRLIPLEQHAELRPWHSVAKPKTKNTKVLPDCLGCLPPAHWRRPPTGWAAARCVSVFQASATRWWCRPGWASPSLLPSLQASCASQPPCERPRVLRHQSYTATTLRTACWRCSGVCVCAERVAIPHHRRRRARAPPAAAATTDDRSSPTTVCVVAGGYVCRQPRECWWWKGWSA